MTLRNEISGLRKVVAGVDDAEALERNRRFYYNLRLVSTIALEISLLSMITGAKCPEWAQQEFLQPIPADAHPIPLAEAELEARRALSGASAASDDDWKNHVPKVVADVEKLVGETFDTLNDVKQFIEQRCQDGRPATHNGEIHG